MTVPSPEEMYTHLDAAADDFLRDPTEAVVADPVERVTDGRPLVPVGGGMARQVFHIPASSHPWDSEVVVKFPLTPDHVSANRREVECWESVEGSEWERFFAPLVASADDHRWLVQYEVYETGVIGRGEDVERRLKADGVPYGEVSDENVGILDDRLVVCDYQWGNLNPNDA